MTQNNAGHAALLVAGDVVQAVVVRALISDDHYQTLAGPWEAWEAVGEPIFTDES